MSDTSKSHWPHWLNWLTHVLLREPHDREALIEVLRDAEQRSLLDPQALSMLEGVLRVSEMCVREIMVPRSEMIVIEHDATPEALVNWVIEAGHSRFPVLGKDSNTIIGILLAKDVLRYAHVLMPHEKPWTTLLRPVAFVPESKRLDMLLQEFRRNRNHMAIVVDEYGVITGLITIEDVLEEIVGEIDDEHDTPEAPHIRPHMDGGYLVDAVTPLETFNDFFNSEFENTDIATIGGVVLQAFSHVPKRGELIEINGFVFRIANADHRRIRVIEVTPPVVVPS